MHVPDNILAREDATASPGINVLSSISIPNKSRSRPEPKPNLASKDETSSRTALKQVIGS